MKKILILLFLIAFGLSALTAQTVISKPGATVTITCYTCERLPTSLYPNMYASGLLVKSAASGSTFVRSPYTIEVTGSTIKVKDAVGYQVYFTAASAGWSSAAGFMTAIKECGCIYGSGSGGLDSVGWADLTQAVQDSIQSGGSITTTLYSGNGSLAGDRLVTGSNNSLGLTGVDSFLVDADILDMVVSDTATITAHRARISGTERVYITSAGTTGSSLLELYSAGQLNAYSGQAAFYTGGVNRLNIGATGKVTIPGVTELSGSIVTNSTPSDGNFYVTSGNTGLNLSSAQYNFAGGIGTLFRTGFYGSGIPAAAVLNNYGAVVIGSGRVSTFTSGTHDIFSNFVVKPIGAITIAGTAALTNTASLYVEGAASEGVNNYALWVDDGISRFDGDITVPDEAYGAGWNGSLESPTKNAIYDKIEAVASSGGLIVMDEFTASAAQVSFTLSSAPGTRKVVFYRNGIRLSPTCYSVVGTSLTYDPAFNGGQAMQLNDRVNADF